jgi:hypothetical protein
MVLLNLFDCSRGRVLRDQQNFTGGVPEQQISETCTSAQNSKYQSAANDLEGNRSPKG